MHSRFWLVQPSGDTLLDYPGQAPDYGQVVEVCYNDDDTVATFNGYPWSEVL